MISNRLLQCGDVHCNPGPVKNPCGQCGRPVAKTHRFVRCMGCFCNVHIKCANVTPASYNQINQGNAPWICDQCICPTFNFSDSYFNVSNISDDVVSDFETSQVSHSDDEFTSVNFLRHIKTSHRNNFMASYLNINSLRYKFTEIHDLIVKNSMDFLCVAETKLDDSYSDALFEIDNYRTFRRDNSSFSGGLLAIVRSDIPCHLRSDFVCKFVETLCIEVTLTSKKILVACLYRNPRISNADFENDISTLVEKIIVSYDRYLLIGDLNFDMTDNGSGQPLTDLCHLYDLHNVILSPTCFKTNRGSLIDVALVPDRRTIQTSGVIDTGLSDYHRLIYVVTKAHAPRHVTRTIKYRSFKTLDNAKYLQDLQTLSCRRHFQ
jgi:hypothetical protein